MNNDEKKKKHFYELFLYFKHFYLPIGRYLLISKYKPAYKYSNVINR